MNEWLNEWINKQIKIKTKLHNKTIMMPPPQKKGYLRVEKVFLMKI